MRLPVLVALLSLASPAIAADVVVHVDGVKDKGGTVLVALYAHDPVFQDPAKVVEAKAVAGQVDVALKDVPAGDYVVTAWHDADDDRKLGMAGGRLSEGTAISNAERLRGAPSFAVNKVPIPAAGGAITLAMSYPEDRTGW